MQESTRQFVFNQRRSASYNLGNRNPNSYTIPKNKESIHPEENTSKNPQNSTNQENPIAKRLVFKKADIIATESSEPSYIRFSVFTKQTARIILKEIGAMSADLKPALTEAFDMFFTDFDMWWKNRQHISQRKDKSKPNIGLLKQQLSECNSKIEPLRIECHKWKAYKGFYDISFPQIEIITIEKTLLEKDEYMKNILKQFDEEMKNISLNIQKKNKKRDDVNELFNGILELNRISKIDYQKQLTLNKRLTNGVQINSLNELVTV